jgi:hypothetical protein
MTSPITGLFIFYDDVFDKFGHRILPLELFMGRLARFVATVQGIS